MTGFLHALHAGVLGLLFIAVCLGCGIVAARWLGVRPTLALPVGFGCTALAGLFAFCAWWISPAIGGAVSLALGLGGVALTAAQIADANTRNTLRDSLPQIVPTLMLAAAWLCLMHAVWQLTATMPVDNQLPRMLADRIAAANFAGPLSGDWLMSDRPPLQAGVLLLFRPFGAGSGPASETIATLCQLMWLPALVALGRVLLFGWRSIAIGILFAATSGFFLLNSVYTWPKLMAAALFITAVTVVMESNRTDRPRSTRTAIAAGALLALATQAHGGVWFSLLALPALPSAWIALRRFGFKGCLALVLVFVAVNVPWSIFKRSVDPPGNRLEKWHLAGAVEIDGRTTLEAVRDAYARTPAAELLHARVVNFRLVAGFLGRHPDERLGDYIRRLQFFHFLPAVGLPLLGVGWIIIRRIRGRLRDAGDLELIVHVAATVLVWLALTFQPGGAIVHAGSYAPVALLIFLGGAAMACWHPVGLAAVAIAHVVLFLTGWVFITPPAGGPTTSTALITAAAVMTIGALASIPMLGRRELADRG